MIPSLKMCINIFDIVQSSTWEAKKGGGTGRKQEDKKTSTRKQLLCDSPQCRCFTHTSHLTPSTVLKSKDCIPIF